MAHRYFPLYNVDQPVGPGKVNKPDDVRLVQAFFIELSRYDNEWVQNLPPQSRNLGTTAKFDETLGQWILTFQKFCVKKYPSLHVKADGIIDPLPNATPIDLSTTFKSGRVSTLALMCNRLWRYNQNAYMQIGDAYQIPWTPDPSSWHV